MNDSTLFEILFCDIQEILLQRLEGKYEGIS
jgi:hypothetical protein